MASPQTEDGYTRIAHELLEAMYRHQFSKRQYKVLLYVIRKTYGFNKKSDDMTVTQIANAVGITRPHASEALRQLEAMNTVLIRDGQYGYVIGLNKDYSKWCTVPKRDTSQNGTTPVPKEDGPPSQNGTHKRQLPKDNPQKKGGALEALKPAGVSDQTWTDFIEHRKAVKKPLTEVAAKRMATKLRKLWGEGSHPEDVLEQSIINGWQGVFAVKGGSRDTYDPMREAI